MTENDLQSFIDEIKKETGTLPADLHITRKACALVAISNGKVIKIQEPEVHYCPLFKSLFSFESINKESIEKKFDRQASHWGMFTGNRRICDEKIIVPFGASEMIMYALKRRNIDAAVIACEGAGTVITSNPAVVQGIGAYMNGLFYTTPIPEIIERIIKNGAAVLSAADAGLDQYEGVKKAAELGYKKIAVTVRGDEQILDRIRKYNSSLDIVILSICNTGINSLQADHICKSADLAWACASKELRKIAGPSAIMQVGMKIPVFILTKRGLDFISSYSSDPELQIKLNNADRKHYITANKFRQGSIKINMGRFSVFLYETDELPVDADDRPEPLV